MNNLSELTSSSLYDCIKLLFCLCLLLQIICKSIRDLLTIEEPDWTRSISLPPRSDLGRVILSDYFVLFYLLFLFTKERWKIKVYDCKDVNYNSLYDYCHSLAVTPFAL